MAADSVLEHLVLAGKVAARFGGALYRLRKMQMEAPDWVMDRVVVAVDRLLLPQEMAAQAQRALLSLNIKE
jgi:hypothetical protein